MPTDAVPNSGFNKIKWLVIIITWLLSQVFYFYQYGVITDLEAIKYINEANNLLNSGQYSTGNFIFYSVQILLIAFSKWAGIFPWFIVMVQIIVNGISIFFFYKLAVSISGSVKLSYYLTFFFLLMLYYHQYNVYLFTESLYFSFSIIYTYILFNTRKLNAGNILLLIIGLTIIYFTRPTGVFFLPATIIYLVFRFYRRNAWWLIAGFSVAGIFLLYFLLNYALDSGGEFDFLLPYLDERIICGVPTIEGKHPIVVPGEKNSIEGLWYIITHHTSLFFELALKRLAAFWGVVRPFYNLPHNLFIAFYFGIVYIFIILGLRKMVRENLAETGYFICLILLMMITVMLSCDEWHNRFILTLLPFFLLLASGGLSRFKFFHPDDQ